MKIVQGQSIDDTCVQELFVASTDLLNAKQVGGDFMSESTYTVMQRF